MHISIWKKIEEILKKHVLHGKWIRAVIALACVVIFITTYVLIMPAVTLSRAAGCGQEEHTHTEDCYETETELTCGQEEHTHTEDCYDEEGNLICGMEEHVHDDSCYTSREVLVCGQEEHVHTEDCYAEEEVIQEDIQEEAEEGFVSENEEEQPEAGDTDIEQVGTAAPEQLSQIRFKNYLTDWTTLYYAAEDGDNWQPLAEDKWHSLYQDNWGIRRSDTADRGLDPEEYVLLHIGYRIPAGQINATNPEAEFILPLSVRMTEEEVRDNNNNNNTLFRGTDREADELFVDGEYEIKEEWNSDGEVTQRKLVITFNEDACLRCGGEKLTDGTETLAAEELEGFFELRVKAEDLLTLEKKSESAYVLEWNDEEDLDTIVRFAPEKLAAYYGEENTEDTEAEPEIEGPVSGELRAEGEDYTITVSYTEEAGLPADVSLKVKEITRKKEYESYKSQMEEELIDPESTKVTGARFFDITLEDSEGNELHPESGVRVLIETKDTLQENEKVQICHFDEEKDKPVEVESLEVTGETYEEENLGVEFEAESFSVYGVVYTVDFEYSVNGKIYQFSLPGGGFVSFTDLVEVLGIIGDTNSDNNGEENNTKITENAEANGSYKETEESSVDSDTNTVLTLGDVEVSEATREFVADVVSVDFSNSELVDVSKVKNETTVGQIKENRGLECEYSAELTEEQIADINAQTVEAGDWALVSMRPFTSEEVLTVTMKDGEVFTIRVTDAVKGTIITDEPVSGKVYAIIIKKDGKYYSVFNDGTLRSVDGAYNPETNKIDVELDYPLLWNYNSGHQNSWNEFVGPPTWYVNHPAFDYTNLSIPAEASGFHENHLPNGYYNRYIDPTASEGTRDENQSNRDLRENCTITYSNNHILAGNNYIGISSDGLRIIGNVTEANAAEIYLAETTVPNPDNSTHNDHMVNHIDISIDGASEIRIPLAYGDYQNRSGTTIYTSSEANHIITVTPDISISTEDMKNAVITASAIVDGERQELDDVFYVTGYSQNDKTSSDAKDQLRIEGSFKVSNIPYADNGDNRQEIREARKANPIDYSVTVTKTVPVTVKYNGQELYANGQKLVFNVPISLTASFNYWQNTNKCPPLHVNFDENGPFVQDWIDGKIVGSGFDMSGMDFDLAAAAVGSTSKPAIEINKIEQKEDGSYLETKTAHEVGVEVYYKEKASGAEDALIGVGVDNTVDEETLSELTSGYTKLHNKELAVGTGGIGAIYDYDVQTGLLYIKEDPDKVEEYLTGTDGKLYQYISTRIETEYNWRTQGDENKLHHADGMTSVPEVLGAYTYNGANLSNGFLPFYIYNVYKEIETVDVPVDKNWPELGDGYTWSATFALQEIEVHESGPERSDANTTHWVNVDDAGTITIHNGDSEADRTFSDLPKYRHYKNENGEDSVYRIVYSVDEIEYELKQNGTTVSKWDKDHGLTVGEDIYAPQFPHDAGDSNDEMHLTEDDPLFYHVIVENHKTDVSVRKELTNLKIQKSWEEGALESAGVDESEAQAVFQLRRYETKTYHEYDTGLYDGSDCVVRLYDKDGGLVQSMTVKKGAKMKVVATFSSSGAIHYMINNSGNDDIQLSWYSGDSTVNSSSFTVTGNIDIKKCVGQYYTPDWSGNVTESHLEYYSSDGSETDDDTVFANEKHYYLVNHNNDWSQTIESLPLIAESAVHNGQQTIYSYSYYFAEVSSNPSGFYSEFTDGHGNPIGDSGHRVTEDDTMIHALNKSIPPFAVEKKWYSVDDPESYPEIRFTLYQGRINNGRVEQGTVFVDGSGKRYEDIPLNSKNDWHWDCPTYLPETDAAGNPVGYYIMEKTSGNNSGHVLLYQNSTLDDAGFIREAGALIDPGTGEKFDVKPLDYYNNKNDNHAKTNDQNFPNGWNGGIAGNEGTLTVLNRTSKYMQMDIKKKILQVDPTDGHVDTIMDEPEKMKDIVLEIQLKRLVFDATTGQQISTDWENYGVPFMIGFDSNNQPIMDNPNNFVLVKQGGFFWRIVLNTTEADQYGFAQNVGLPAYGYYTKDDGTIIPVRYRYIPFEIGVYSDLNKTPAKPEFEWFAGLQPAAWDGNGSQVDTFAPMLPNHDQDRIKNIQASDLYVEKVWEELPTNIQEIYVKLYRSRGENGEREDVTADIAKRTETFSGYGFVEDPSYLTTSVQNGVLVIKPETGEIHLHGLPLVFDTDNYHNQPYYYWVEEVGYKDAKGNIYTDTAKFYPLYDKWDASTETWSEWTANGKAAASSLGQVSRNRIRANNAPTTEFKVKKEWYDENGTELDAPWDSSISSISFSVKRVAQKYTRNSTEDEWTAAGEPDEAELTFDNGSTSGNTITVNGPGQRAQVAVKQSGGTEYSISYMNDADDPEDIGSWATVVDGLQKSHKVSDTELWRYSYMIGKEFTIAQCDTVISNNGVIAEGETVTITNTKTDKTSVTVTKTFTGLQSIDDIPDDFQITATWGNQARVLKVKDMENYSDVTLSAEGLVFTWVISELNPGTTVTFQETGYEKEGYTVTVKANDIDITSNSQKTTSVTSVADSTSSAAFENIYEKNPGNLELKKKVAGQAAETTKEFSFTIELEAPTGQTLAESYRFTKTGITGEQTVTLSRTDNNTKATITGIDLKADDVYTIIGLPAGTSYTITESDYSSDGYSSAVTGGALKGTINGGTTAKEAVEVTNTFEPGGLTVQKITSGSGVSTDDEFTFKVTIQRNNSASENHGQYTIDGSTFIPVAFTSGKAEVVFTLKGGQTATFSGLQKNAAFVVEELSADQNGYITSAASTGGSVADKKVSGIISKDTAVAAVYTNHRDSFSLDILKKEKNSDRKLRGATFELNKIDDNATSISIIQGTKQEVTTQVNGEASFNGLTSGVYEVKETKSPDGYVLTTNSEFYILVSGEGIKLLVKQDGVAPRNWQTTTAGYGIIKTFTATAITDTETENALTVLENTPGAALPNTGGPGTRFFTISGSILILGAGVLLWRRRRLI